MAHSPFLRTIEPDVISLEGIRVPKFPSSLESNKEDEIAAAELLEWLSLVAMDSPRVREADDIDSYLCRYDIPDFATSSPSVSSESGASRLESAVVQDLIRLRWHGFMGSSFITKIFAAAIKATSTEDGEWFAMRAEGFDGHSYTVLKKDGKAMTWECD